MFASSNQRSACTAARLHRRHRISVAVLVTGSAVLVSGGAFASWTTTSTVSSGTVSAATTAVSVLDTNSTAFTAAAPDLLPSDYFYRYVDLRNDGTSSSTFTGQVTATGDLAGALLGTVERCSISWTSSDTCLGATTTLSAEAAIDSTGVTVNYGSIGSGAANAAHVRYRFKMADNAPATLQGKTGTLAVSVSGASVGGRNRTTG